MVSVTPLCFCLSFIPLVLAFFISWLAPARSSVFFYSFRDLSPCFLLRFLAFSSPIFFLFRVAHSLCFLALVLSVSCVRFSSAPPVLPLFLFALLRLFFVLQSLGPASVFICSLIPSFPPLLFVAFSGFYKAREWLLLVHSCLTIVRHVHLCFSPKKQRGINVLINFVAPEIATWDSGQETCFGSFPVESVSETKWRR